MEEGEENEEKRHATMCNKQSIKIHQKHIPHLYGPISTKVLLRHSFSPIIYIAINPFAFLVLLTESILGTGEVPNVLTT